jgi:hypothetical protein
MIRSQRTLTFALAHGRKLSISYLALLLVRYKGRLVFSQYAHFWCLSSSYCIILIVVLFGLEPSFSIYGVSQSIECNVAVRDYTIK